MGDLVAGGELKVDLFSAGQIVDVTGTTVGKGFAGTMKRHRQTAEATAAGAGWDLDLAVSCKTCPTSLLFENDGRGRFADVTKGRMPAVPDRPAPWRMSISSCNASGTVEGA